MYSLVLVNDNICILCEERNNQEKHKIQPLVEVCVDCKVLAGENIHSQWCEEIGNLMTDETTSQMGTSCDLVLKAIN
jgi:hypothetical protein